MTSFNHDDFRRHSLFLAIALAILFLGIGLGLTFSSKLGSTSSLEQSPQVSSAQVSGASAFQESSPQSTFERQQIRVVRVIDGDTVELEGGQKVRYIGIDTPEIVHPQKPVECFGREAANINKELVEGKIVELEKDVSETDKYQRLLRYVYVGDIFVNDYLVRQGYAHASSYPPDVKYQDLFRQAEQEAQSHNRGLWEKCSATEQQPSVSSQLLPEGDCKIKGNISSTGEKIYHLPGQYYYDRTVIDESRGEKWFCSEDEAITAGWRKSKK